MKKVFIIAVAALFCAAACKAIPVEERLENYKTELKSLQDAFQAEYKSLRDSVGLSDNQKADLINARYKVYTDESRALSLKAFKKNKENVVAVEAFKNLYYQIEDPAELQKLLDSMSEENRQDEKIQKYQAVVTALLATAEGCQFTDFTIVQDPENPEESTVKFSDYIGKGKYVLVDFWASWCGPCKGEIPNLKSVYEKFGGDDFDVLSIAVWDKPEDTKASAIEHGVVWSQIINAQKIPTDIYGINGIPQIILFGPDGKIVKRDLRGEAIAKEVGKYVKAK